MFKHLVPALYVDTHCMSTRLNRRFDIQCVSTYSAFSARYVDIPSLIYSINITTYDCSCDPVLYVETHCMSTCNRLEQVRSERDVILHTCWVFADSAIDLRREPIREGNRSAMGNRSAKSTDPRGDLIKERDMRREWIVSHSTSY